MYFSMVNGILTVIYCKCPKISNTLLYARLKNGTYGVTGYGIRTVSFPADSSYSLNPIKLKLGI